MLVSFRQESLELGLKTVLVDLWSKFKLVINSILILLVSWQSKNLIKHTNEKESTKNMSLSPSRQSFFISRFWAFDWIQRQTWSKVIEIQNGCLIENKCIKRDAYAIWDSYYPIRAEEKARYGIHWVQHI